MIGSVMKAWKTKVVSVIDRVMENIVFGTARVVLIVFLAALLLRYLVVLLFDWLTKE
jgi:hypothetical protein